MSVPQPDNRYRVPDGPVAVVGGAGFIGCNLADSFLADGAEVIVADNLSRPGVEANLAWLQERYGARIRTALVDVRDPAGLRSALREARAVFHLAAQVAVTSSMVDPKLDFSVNAEGTLNILETLRATKTRVPVVFASTNKVYGGLEDVEMIELDDRYVPVSGNLRMSGVDESRRLDFHTPYGCSKGVADQYVLDYARSFDFPTAVLRMSCIYGPRQFGTEDQGWVAHFALQALRDEPIVVFGNGKQVRDILHVRDAVAAYRGVLDRIGELRGRVFNLGGGPRNAVSLLAVLREIRRASGRETRVKYGDWRPGDQLYFVADTRSLQKETGWSASVGWRDGLADLLAWLETIRTRPAPVARSSVA